MIIVFLLAGKSFSQKHNFGSKSELGVMGGVMYYVGDLNPYHHFRDFEAGLGLIYKYNITAHFAFRLTGLYGKLTGDDSKSTASEFRRNRNLHFRSNILEIGAGFEINFFKYRLQDFKHPISPYLIFQVAYFHMNPQASRNGNWTDLQPLGTEGQGSSQGGKRYSLHQIAFPIGLGLKFNIARGISLGVEYTFRFTFTDYLDDVSKNYVDPDILGAENGPDASYFSDRSLTKSGPGGVNTGSQRGDQATKDWYGFLGATLTFRLARMDRCPFNSF
ncbi:MAG: outer membrane beta-barrel protein [Crocinitomicaceae bacterium]|nr:outer membrane beta-barrel protein [Crocinitomicaceae bacterium]